MAAKVDAKPAEPATQVKKEDLDALEEDDEFEEFEQGTPINRLRLRLAHLDARRRVEGGRRGR